MLLWLAIAYVVTGWWSLVVVRNWVVCKELGTEACRGQIWTNECYGKN